MRSIKTLFFIFILCMAISSHAQNGFTFKQHIQLESETADTVCLSLTRSGVIVCFAKGSGGSYSLIADNGLTYVNDTLRFGGSLIEATILDGNGYELSFSNIEELILNTINDLVIYAGRGLSLSGEDRIDIFSPGDAITIIPPTGAGSSGDVLTNIGSGEVEWQAPSGGGSSLFHEVGTGIEAIDTNYNHFSLSRTIGGLRHRFLDMDSTGYDGYLLSKKMGLLPLLAEATKQAFGNPPGTFNVYFSGDWAHKNDTNYVAMGAQLVQTPYGNFYQFGTNARFNQLEYSVGVQNGNGLFTGGVEMSENNKTTGRRTQFKIVGGSYEFMSVGTGTVKFNNDNLTGTTDITWQDLDGTLAYLHDLPRYYQNKVKSCSSCGFTDTLNIGRSYQPYKDEYYFTLYDTTNRIDTVFINFENGEDSSIVTIKNEGEYPVYLKALNGGSPITFYRSRASGVIYDFEVLRLSSGDRVTIKQHISTSPIIQSFYDASKDLPFIRYFDASVINTPIQLNEWDYLTIREGVNADNDTLYLPDLDNETYGGEQFQFVNEDTTGSLIIVASGDDVIINPNNTTNPLSIKREDGILGVIWRDDKWYVRF